MKKNIVLATVLCVAIAMTAGCSQGSKQNDSNKEVSANGNYPVSKMTFLCPSDAGGAMDNNTRFLAPYLEKYIGVPVNVINMGGSACWVGWNHLTENPADGSMISYANFPNMLTGYLDPAASINLNRSDFEFLALYTSDDNVIMAKKDETRFGDAKGFFEYAKDNVVTIGTAGARTDDAVAIAILEKELGFSFQHVHYQNSAEGFAAVMGGHIDVLMGNVSEASVKGDEIKPIAVLAEERSEYLPEVQCTYENGIKAASSSSRGIIAAKGLDPVAKEALLKAMKEMMEDPQQLEEAKKQGIAVTPIYGEDFENWMAEQEEMVKGIFDMLDE